MTDLAGTRRMIAHVIDTMGGDAEKQQMNDHSWVLNKGSAIGYVTILRDQDEPEAAEVLVRFRIMKNPEPESSFFYRRLLALNEDLIGRAAFSISEDDLISLQAGRPAKDLNPSELMDLIGRTALLADHYDDLLLDEFGRENALD